MLNEVKNYETDSDIEEDSDDNHEEIIENKKDNLNNINEIIDRRFIKFEENIDRRLNMIEKKLEGLILNFENKLNKIVKDLSKNTLPGYENQWDDIELNLEKFEYNKVGKMFKDYTTEVEIIKLLFPTTYPFRLRSPRVFEHYHKGEWTTDKDGTYICKILFDYFTKIELKINSSHHSNDNLTLFIENQGHICKLEDEKYRRNFMKYMKDIIS